MYTQRDVFLQCVQAERCVQCVQALRCVQCVLAERCVQWVLADRCAQCVLADRCAQCELAERCVQWYREMLQLCAPRCVQCVHAERCVHCSVYKHRQKSGLTCWESRNTMNIRSNYTRIILCLLYFADILCQIITSFYTDVGIESWNVYKIWSWFACLFLISWWHCDLSVWRMCQVTFLFNIGARHNVHTVF